MGLCLLILNPGVLGKASNQYKAMRWSCNIFPISSNVALINFVAGQVLADSLKILSNVNGHGNSAGECFQEPHEDMIAKIINVSDM